MLIDFHTHTTASDGTLTPAELLDRSCDAGIKMLAITDHDTVEGYQQARAAIAERGPCGPWPQLIAGVEMSCQWSGMTIHVLGLGVTCDHPAMQEALQCLAEARRDRGVTIDARLARRGFDGALAGALVQAGSSQLGRPHFAAWMVQQGYVRDHNEAFDRYLGQGKTGDVKAFWPSLQQVSAWITQAGGVALLAHPCKYRLSGMKLRRLLADFVAAGGEGLEISSGQQTPDQVRHLRRLAREMSLEVSVGSDFHRDRPYGPALGVSTEAYEDLRGVWHRWSSAEAGSGLQ
ncbi:MAG: PHP domain-containing protein [Pseudomonadota bacterium]